MTESVRIMLLRARRRAEPAVAILISFVSSPRPKEAHLIAEARKEVLLLVSWSSVPVLRHFSVDLHRLLLVRSGSRRSGLLSLPGLNVFETPETDAVLADFEGLSHGAEEALGYDHGHVGRCVTSAN